MNVVNAIEETANQTYTENGALTLKTTGDACLDLFATIGALRHVPDHEICLRFQRAYAENRDIAMKILKGIEEISFVELTNKDVVRHPLVQKIVHAYEKYEARRAYKESRKPDTNNKKYRVKNTKCWTGSQNRTQDVPANAAPRITELPAAGEEFCCAKPQADRAGRAFQSTGQRRVPTEI